MSNRDRPSLLSPTFHLPPAHPRPETIGKTLTLSGPKAYTVQDVIELCEKYSGGSEARVSKVPLGVLKGTRAFLSAFEWAKDAADRLAFAEVIQSNGLIQADMTETYK